MEKIVIKEAGGRLLGDLVLAEGVTFDSARAAFKRPGTRVEIAGESASDVADDRAVDPGESDPGEE